MLERDRRTVTSQFMISAKRTKLASGDVAQVGGNTAQKHQILKRLEAFGAYQGAMEVQIDPLLATAEPHVVTEFSAT